MKKPIMLTWALAAALSFAACSDDDDNNNNGNPDPDPIVQDGISGDMTLIEFKANTTYEVTGDLFVPEEQTVTIPEGVTFEFQEGENGEAWFVEVYGSLRVMGSENNRCVFTASEELISSSKNQGIGQLWGGIIGTNVTGDLVLQHTDIWYAGGTVREENAMANPETGGGGELSAGDASYALYFVREQDFRQDGIFVLTHCHIAFTPDDAIRVNGGTTLMSYNTFEVTGGTGGDAVNLKGGSNGDYGFNLFYNCATNGLKAADSGPGVRGICENNFYNNTLVSCGYRRAEPGRGAGLNYESNAFGNCYNNLQVNTRFGLRLVPGEDAPNVAELNFGYNWYYGAVQTVVDEFYPSEATSSVGMIGNDPSTPIPSSDVTGAPLENNPLFVNFDPSGFQFSGNSTISTDPLATNIEGIPSNADFHLTADSPAAQGAFTDFQPVNATYTTLDGEYSFTPPTPASFFGAFGVN